MRYLKSMVLLLLFLLTFIISYPQAMLKSNNNIEDNPHIRIVDKIYRSKNDYLDVNVIIPQLEGLKNKEGQEAINSKIVKWTEDWINDVTEIADDYFKNGPTPLMSYQLYATYKVINNNDIISFYIDYYQFTGGAHGVTTRIAYNIDKKEAKELLLGDLFIKNYDYKTPINKEIQRQISKDPDKYFPGKDGFKGISDKQSFYIENGYIIVYFGLYEIAPYAAGIPEFVIPIKLLDNNLIYVRV